MFSEKKMHMQHVEHLREVLYNYVAVYRKSHRLALQWHSGKQSNIGFDYLVSSCDIILNKYVFIYFLLLPKLSFSKDHVG